MKRIKMIAKTINRTMSNPQRRAKTIEQNKQLLQPKKNDKKRSEKMEKRLSLKKKVEDSIKKVRAQYKQKIKNVNGKDAKDNLRKKRDVIIRKLKQSYTNFYKKQGINISSKKSNSSKKAPSKKESWWKRAINKVKGFFK